MTESESLLNSGASTREISSWSQHPCNTLPNSSLVLPLNKSIINTTYATISYKWSPRSQLSLGGDYSLGRYDLASLQAQTRYGVNVSYSYRLAERTTLNLSYAYSNFDQSRVQLNPTDPSITPSSKATATTRLLVFLTS